MSTQHTRWLRSWWLIALLILSALFSGCDIRVDRNPETPTPTPVTVSPTSTETETALPPTPTPSLTPTSTETPLPPTPTPEPPVSVVPSSIVCEGKDITVSADAVTINVIYSLDFTGYMAEVMHHFNCANAQGNEGTPAIYVTGQGISSGEAAKLLSLGDSVPNPLRPTIYIPSSRLWLSVVNDKKETQFFYVDEAPASAVAPLVMAIWESYLQKLQTKYGQAIGWRELLDLFRAEDGWQSVGLEQKAIGYGHTSPYISSAGFSAWVMEFYAAARYCADQDKRQPLTLEIVENDDVQNCVRQIEEAIKHYAAHTVIFREYMVKGPSYVSIVPLEENDLILINEGKWGKPPEKLVALYPDDGTFLSEHPLAIPNADWVSDDQRTAAQHFIDFVLTKEMQQLTMEYAFRPADATIPLTARFGPDNGVDPNQPNPAALLPQTAPSVLGAIQRQWGLIKKQAEIVLLIDVSDSMSDTTKISDGNGGEKTVTKLQQAQLAAQTFLRDQAHGNRVSIVTFNSKVTPLRDMCILEECRDDLIATVDTLIADGGTALFDALQAAIQQLSQITDSNRIKAVVVISDGGESGHSSANEVDITKAIRATQETRSPVLVIPIAYAYDKVKDEFGLGTLAYIATTARTKVFEGDVSEIEELLREIGEYFP